MEIKAVVLDRDGVLTRFAVAEAVTFFQPLLPLSLAELSHRWNQWGEQVGFPRNLTEEKHFFQTFWHGLSEEFSLLDATREELLRVEYTTFLRAFPDARPALLDARRRGLQTAVLSNFTLASLDTSLAAVQLLDLVDKACAATVIGAAKPTPAAYEITCHSLGVLPQECLFFDDELPCVEGGRAVGMHAYLVDRRRTTHALQEYLVADLTAIPEILATMSVYP